MMNMKDFVEAVKDSVSKKLGKKYQVSVCKADKNNKMTYIGLNVEQKGLAVTPIVYLNEYFKQYENGTVTISQTADYVVRMAKAESPKIDVNQYLSYENVKEKVVYRIINTEKNKELLEDLPHIAYMDLSIVFRVLVEECCSGASILVHNVHMKLWDVTVEELYADAEENTRKLEGCEMENFVDVLCEICGEKNRNACVPDQCSNRLSGDVPMYIFSNKNKLDGACCMLYTDLIRNFADEIDSSLYIIPSSIHELLLVPSSNTDDRETMKNMIKEVNDTHLEPEEILSYSLYYYSREDGRISML